MIPWGAVHLRASRPKTSAPTGECGVMGFELRVTDSPTSVDCWQCARKPLARLLTAGFSHEQAAALAEAGFDVWYVGVDRLIGAAAS